MTAEIEVVGDAEELNGPLRPRAKIGHAYYVGGDPAVLVSDIGGYDDHGFVQTIQIDWGDGHTETVDRPIEFCDTPRDAHLPSGWFSKPVEHRYEEAGEYLVKVEVVSVGCDGRSPQRDSAERTWEFPPEQGSWLMGTTYTATCQDCGTHAEVNEGPGMSSMPLRCTRCGRERWWEFREKIPLDDPPGWSCSCGGRFETDAPPRCLSCRSVNLKRDSEGIEILYD